MAGLTKLRDASERFKLMAIEDDRLSDHKTRATIQQSALFFCLKKPPACGSRIKLDCKNHSTENCSISLGMVDRHKPYYEPRHSFGRLKATQSSISDSRYSISWESPGKNMDKKAEINRLPNFNNLKSCQYVVCRRISHSAW